MMMPHRQTRMRPSRPPGLPHNPITTLCTWRVLRWRASMGRVARIPRRRDTCRRMRMRWGGRAGGRRRRAGMRAGASRWKRRRRPCGQGSCPLIGQQGPVPRSVGVAVIAHRCPASMLGPTVSSNGEVCCRSHSLPLRVSRVRRRGRRWSRRLQASPSGDAHVQGPGRRPPWRHHAPRTPYR